MKTLILIIAIGSFVFAGYTLISDKNTETSTIDTKKTHTSEESVIEEPDTETRVSDNIEGDVSADGAKIEAGADTTIKEFAIEGRNFSFMPASMNVNKGDTVRVTFKNIDGFHDFVIDEFSASTKKIRSGEQETIEFVANSSGTFEYYCSVGSHRAQGMVGVLTVN